MEKREFARVEAVEPTESLEKQESSSDISPANVSESFEIHNDIYFS